MHATAAVRSASARFAFCASATASTSTSVSKFAAAVCNLVSAICCLQRRGALDMRDEVGAIVVGKELADGDAIEAVERERKMPTMRDPPPGLVRGARF